ncbi:TerC/Alx family metal homeostasis membrane protein [Flaviaesturariibacter aridisoli]|uniref:TerC/Alx family metal homeostasis membrane protein n=1 Tax=Flaviaesturariibacter aridisoli TaxID=2545761 RepID=A0A4R4E5G9_9BACT|nr:TerC/Alx family metal homeostasis membrane protein [Flaviaesturariibacter aridisoli]TCZ74884.1 TerC/Alx family metal homeostasis membrane protein [Flaviaesturariibacter aridisoli]
MTLDQLSYLVFGLVVLIALVLDLGLLSKRSTEISIKKALYQTLFWVSLAFAFFGFLWYEYGKAPAIEYISAYLMEWSLSIDNIFVFILIFTFFRIASDHVARALLWGILMAIIFRVIFITVGVALVERFHWLLYIFGGFLVYTGIKIFTVKESDEGFDPGTNPVYKFLNRFLPIVHEDVGGKLTIKRNGKRFFTNLFVVIVMLATTDIVFALDSIPAVFAIVTESKQRNMIIYTSNIFAVLGLRSLFFLLKGAVNRFAYLQQGIAIVLVFIGLKMLVPLVYSSFHMPVVISLIVIVVCLGGSVLYSINATRRQARENDEI